MTLTMAWIRRVGPSEELLLAADSRLRFGQAWDACPKLFTTARQDVALGFAGGTLYAYPLLLQAVNHMALHYASLTRQLDIYDAKGHLERVFQRMLEDVADLPRGSTSFESPDALFVLGGFSWRRRHFALWRVSYDGTVRRFVWMPVGGVNRLAILGSPTMSDRQRAAIRRAERPCLFRERMTCELWRLNG